MRRLPACAVCGGSLVRRGRVLLRYGNLPGKPEVGWHSEKKGLSCLDKEPFKAEILHDAEEDLDTIPSRTQLRAILQAIHVRGTDRVQADMDWWRIAGALPGTVLKCDAKFVCPKCGYDQRDETHCGGGATA